MGIYSGLSTAQVSSANPGILRSATMGSGGVMDSRDRIVRMQSRQGVDPEVVQQALAAIRGNAEYDKIVKTRQFDLAKNPETRRVIKARLDEEITANPRLEPLGDNLLARVSRDNDDRSDFRRQRYLDIETKTDLVVRDDLKRRYFRDIRDVPAQQLEQFDNGKTAKDLVPQPPRLNPHLIYRRPQMNNDLNVFRDLAGYAPGLRANEMDLLALLEAEGAESAPRLGKIDPRARVLIDRARSAGWQTVTIPDADFTLVCNGAGSYRYERILSSALREVVICDGTALYHLYPELGLGGRRTVSRYHRSELSELVPWSLPPAEDLARGADLIRVDERTVAVVAPGRLCVQLVFAEDGRLMERQITDKPGGKVLSREIYDADGAVRRIVEGKEILVGTWKIKASAAPDLKPDEKEFVLLPVPARTREHVMQVRKTTDLGDYQKMDPALALELIAGEYAQNRELLLSLVTRRFLYEGDRRLGFYVLLYSAGVELNTVPTPNRDKKLLIEAYMHNTDAGAEGWKGGPFDSFTSQMSVFRSLSQKPDLRHTDKLLSFVKECRSPVMVWAIALRGWGKSLEGDGRSFLQELFTAVLPRMKGIPALEYAARYELGLALLGSAEHEKGNAALLTLYEDTLKQGLIPPVDTSFVTAFLNGTANGPRARQTVADLVSKGYGLALVTLAEQCKQLQVPDVAEMILDTLASSTNKGADRIELTLALLNDRVERQKWEEADRLLGELLADPRQAKRSILWRVGYTIAVNRKQTARAIERLERALDLDYHQFFGVLHLEEVRREYQILAAHYARQAEAMAVLDQKASPEFLAKVMRTADRWRSLDPAGMEAACPVLIAPLLRQAGERNLAWDYQTTPFAQATTDLNQWLQLATQLLQMDEIEQADRAYATVFALDPTNAQVLWNRATNLRNKEGMTPKVRELYGEIVEGPWQPQYQPLQAQAKAILDASR